MAHRLATFAALAAGAAAAAASDSAGNGASASKPNFLVMFVDDWGWGDMGANWPSTKETPHLDQLAAGGMRFTDMHAMSVCTPSRAAILTGRLGLRTGVVSNFWTDALYGLPTSEITIAEMLRPAGYKSYAVGKWHLGHNPPHHPTYRGFDRYVGLPYSVDMGCINSPAANSPPEPPCPYDNATAPAPATSHPIQAALGSANSNPSPALPLYNSSGPNCTGHGCNADIMEQPVNLTTLAGHYATAAKSFIARHAPGGPDAGTPFFLYVPFSHVHVPLAHDPKWTGKSARNTTFGDTLLELDDTAGQILAALKGAGLDENTLVILTGDNGPWEVKCELAGSTGPFKGAYQSQLGGGSTAKMSTWEGGHRVVGVASWPGRVPAGTVTNATASTMDLFPTFAALAGVPLPTDRVYDGQDLGPVLFSDPTAKVRDWLWHPDTLTGNITAARYGQYKAYFQTYGAPGCNAPQSKVLMHEPPLIFDLTADPAESTPLAGAALPQGLVQTFQQGYASMIANIHGTFRSNTSYAEGGQPAWACCNPSHVVCRCTQ